VLDGLKGETSVRVEFISGGNEMLVSSSEQMK